MMQQSQSWAFIWGKPLLQKDTSTPTFSAALFTIAKAQNNLNVHWQRSTTYEQWTISHKKKEWNNAMCSSSIMDWPRDDHVSEVGQAEKGKYHISLIYGTFEKRCEWTYLHNRNRFTDLENELTVMGGRWWGRLICMVGSLGLTRTYCYI